MIHRAETCRRALGALPALVVPAFALVALACGEQARVQVAAQPPAPETVFVRQPEPPPAPIPPLEVSPHKVAFDAIGDTMRLAVPVGSTCATASETIATVDSTGLVRAVANGDTHLRCWLGDRNVSIKVSVTQQLARVAVVADEGLALRKSGDSLHLNLARVDRLGTPVEAVRPSWSSLAPEVVRVDSATGVAIGVTDSGTARIVGAADRFADTVTVEIGAKSATTQLLSATGRNALSRSRTLARASAAQRASRLQAAGGAAAIVTQAAGVPGAPGAAQQPAVPGISSRSSQPADSLFHDPQTGALTFGHGRFLVPTLSAGFAEHRIVGPGGLEKTSGAIFGGALDVPTGSLLSFHFQFMTGTLSKDTTTAQKDRKFIDGSADVGIAIAPWLSILAGVEARRYEALAIERWVMVRAGGEANFSLGGGPLRGIARILLMPLISIASDAPGNVTSPSFGVSSALGLGFENRRISSSLLYDIERYSFPSNTARKEQYGALLFRFGYKFGW